jgi:hypothetical protein
MLLVIWRRITLMQNTATHMLERDRRTLDYLSPAGLRHANHRHRAIKIDMMNRVETKDLLRTEAAEGGLRVSGNRALARRRTIIIGFIVAW